MTTDPTIGMTEKQILKAERDGYNPDRVGYAKGKPVAEYLAALGFDYLHKVRAAYAKGNAVCEPAVRICLDANTTAEELARQWAERQLSGAICDIYGADNLDEERIRGLVSYALSEDDAEEEAAWAEATAA